MIYMKKEYDYLIVGAGLFGATFAWHARQAGKRCLVIDKRPHTGGGVHDRLIEGINVHEYGPHVFHTSDEEVWRLAEYRYYDMDRTMRSAMDAWERECRRKI